MRTSRISSIIIIVDRGFHYSHAEKSQPQRPTPNAEGLASYKKTFPEGS